MEELLYEKPFLTEIISKPDSYQTDPFPYSKIEPSDFEALVYAIYSTEIGNGAFKKFDNISLLKGGRDKGRDCILTRNGKNYGLIQCKRYDRSLKINDVGIEVTKFAMYSLLHPELIHDPEDFTYFIAVTSNFEHRCSEFINDFNNLAIDETQLNSWIGKLLERPELKQLWLDPPLLKIKILFTKIKVVKILPENMDVILHKVENANIINAFFKVTKVTDNTEIQKLSAIIKQNIPAVLNQAELKKQLKGGSFSISCEHNEFEGIKDSHIERVETSELIEWIVRPAQKNKEGKDKNICLLSAGAGMGKTVIIKDLYDELISREIPVLALKADKLYATSIRELQDTIGLSISVFAFIDKCKQEFPLTVFLIDQIDALSQSLSVKREYLTTYTQLIEYCKYDPSIRLVMSVRIFDLLYDPALRRYKDWKSVTVQPLTVEQTTHQLNRLGLTDRQLSRSFVELMRTPNNLNIFSRINRKGLKFSGIDSVQKLYAELWKDKISRQSNLSGTNYNRLSELLYRIVDDMYQEHRITVNERKYEDYGPEITYLQSEHLLKSEEGQIQFFHQTFYDYLFARRFTQGKTTLKAYIKESGQSIKTRAAVKMILNFLREDKHQEYLKLLKSLLSSNQIYFHLKHLIISALATEQTPTLGEKELLLMQISRDYHLLIVFTEYVNSGNWVEFMIKNKLLDCLTKTDLLPSDVPFVKSAYRKLFSEKIPVSNINDYSDSCSSLLKRNLPGNETFILKFLTRVRSVNTIRWLLYSLKKWEDPIAYKLFEYAFNDPNQEYEGFFMVLEDIAEQNSEYAFDRIKDKLTSFEHEDRRSTLERRESALVKKLMEKIPEIVIPKLEAIVTEECTKARYTQMRGKVIQEYHFENISLKPERHNDTQNIYLTLAEGLRKQAEQKSNCFLDFLANHLHSLQSPMIRLLTYSLQPCAKEYAPEVFSLFIHLNDNYEFGVNDRISVALRRLISKAFPFFNTDQQTITIRRILNLKLMTELQPLHEKFIPNDELWGTRWGQIQGLFLIGLPQSLSEQPEVKKRRAEVERRYPKLEEFKSKRYFGPAHQTLNDRAYKFMNEKNWLNSFKTYNGIKNEHNLYKGGKIEHAERFEKILKTGLEPHLNLIKTAVFDPEVPMTYAIKGLSAMQEAKLPVNEFLMHLIKRTPDENDIYHLIELLYRAVQDVDCDEVLLDFVIQKATEQPSENKKTNSNQKRAAESLVHVKDKKLKDKIFTAITQILSSGSSKPRSVILNQLAYLMPMDTEMTASLFAGAVNNMEDLKEMEEVSWSMSFIVNYNFELVLPYFDHALSHSEISDKLVKNLTTILLSCWYFRYSGAEKQFMAFYDRFEVSRSHALDLAIKHFYNDDDVPDPVSYKIIDMVMNDSSKKVSQRLKIKFLHIDHITFSDIYPILEKYVYSKSFRIGGYFLDYLTSNVADHPEKCIDIFDAALASKTKLTDEELSEIQHHNSAGKFIIAAYNVLETKHIELKKKLLRLFDLVLKDTRFRSKTSEILETLID
ncbi:hypothetical protein FBD94_16740 [Pedobacter hiemivivus]|uniref:Restriction endonuclease type IV Mrr domain-containing protein n=1 Tax=Pedobacter hiemivivus TaxID=2530454 RepID=A0A4U1G6D1_9SPHI|nr:restriction endonuclease [Pedobacter hiemivivus]TKC59178.1 hypothetical protein FBD94_16740 [Pedobacter hiemivivus]